MNNVGEKYYLIGEVSKICGIPIRTLHYYNDIGILIPEKVDPNTNYRYYSQGQLGTINAIKHFKDAGFSLKEIELLLKRDDLELNQRMMEAKYKEIEETIERLSILKNRLKIYISDNEIPDLEITLKEIPSCYVAYSRKKAPATHEEFYLRYSNLLNIIKENSFHMTGTMRAIYYDDYREFDYMNTDIEVCVPVLEKVDNTDYIRQFGGYLGVVANHYGSYKTMNKTYGKMLQWIEENGYVFLGEAVENYIIDMVTTVHEDNYITEIILPVSKIY